MKIDSPNAIGTSTGFGIPTGGTTNQILRKIDGTNYNTEWYGLSYASIRFDDSGIPTSINSDITPILSTGVGISTVGNTIIIANPGVYFVSASMSIRCGFAEYSWVDASNATFFTTNIGISTSPFGASNAPTTSAAGIITTTGSNTLIKIRIGQGSGFAPTQIGGYSGAQIIQLR